MTGHYETKFYPIKNIFRLSVEMFHKSKQRSGLFKVSHMPIFFICVFREDIFVFRGTIRCLRFVFWNWHNRYCLFICLYSRTFVICVIVLLKLITSQLISKRENLIFTFIQQHLKSLAPIKMTTKAPKMKMMSCTWSESMTSITFLILSGLTGNYSEKMIKCVYFQDF